MKSSGHFNLQLEILDVNSSAFGGNGDGRVGDLEPRMDANQREYLDAHLIRVYLRSFAVRNIY